MEATGTTSKILLGVGELFVGLHENVRSNEAFHSLAEQLGWNIAEVPAPITALLPTLNQLVASLEAVAIEANVSTLSAVETNVENVFAAIKALSTATYNLGFDATAFKAEFPNQVITTLIINYLSKKQTKIYALLVGLGLINSEFVPADGVRIAFIRKSFNLQLLGDALRDPAAVWKDLYGWEGTFLYDKLVLMLAETLYRLGLSAVIAQADYQLLGNINPVLIPAFESLPIINSVGVTLLNSVTDAGNVLLGLNMLPVLSGTGSY